MAVMGDGDALAIGGNHLIHACRRNIDMTALILNNEIYGMTGGQLAPTTPQGFRSTTSPLGSIETPFDAVELALAAGATYVARTTTFDFDEMPRLIEAAIRHPGFALVEILSQCPTYFGRLNKLGQGRELLDYEKDMTEPLERVTRDELVGKLPIGVFRERSAPSTHAATRRSANAREGAPMASESDRRPRRGPRRTGSDARRVPARAGRHERWPAGRADAKLRARSSPGRDEVRRDPVAERDRVSGGRSRRTSSCACHTTRCVAYCAPRRPRSRVDHRGAALSAACDAARRDRAAADRHRPRMRRARSRRTSSRLGALVGITELVSERSLHEALVARVAPERLALNTQAFTAGLQLAAAATV